MDPLLFASINLDRRRRRLVSVSEERGGDTPAQVPSLLLRPR